MLGKEYMQVYKEKDTLREAWGDNICINEFRVEKLENDFEHKVQVLCGVNYIDCNYAIARIQNIKTIILEERYDI